MIARIVGFLFCVTVLPTLTGCAMVAIGGAATSASVVNDRRTAGTIVDDHAIEVKALNALSHNKPLWKQSHISVISYNNNVLLVGQTATLDFKQQAEAAVQKISRVRHVYNELTVDAPVSLVTRSKDSWITTHIKAKMLGSKMINPTRIKVVTEDGVVYLMGLTTHQEEITATDLARTVPGVEKIVQIFEHSLDNR